MGTVKSESEKALDEIKGVGEKLCHHDRPVTLLLVDIGNTD